VRPGSFTLTVSGSEFAAGARVMYGTTPLSTTYVSSTQLKASGTAGIVSGGLVAVKVVNPESASTTSPIVRLV